MSGRSDLSEYRRAPARSRASAARLPILRAGRATPDTDHRTPLLFDDVAFITRRDLGAARRNRGAPETAVGDAGREPQQDGPRQRQSAVGSEPNAPSASPTAPMLLTVREVEVALQLGRTRTYELLRSGQLPMLRVGRLIRVSRVALEEWIERQTTTGCA